MCEVLWRKAQKLTKNNSSVRWVRVKTCTPLYSRNFLSCNSQLTQTKKLSLFAFKKLTHIREDVSLVSSWWLHVEQYPQIQEHSGEACSSLLITGLLLSLCGNSKIHQRKPKRYLQFPESYFCPQLKVTFQVILSCYHLLLNLQEGKLFCSKPSVDNHFIWFNIKSWEVIKFCSPLPLHK